jgi:hypothetical protein
MFKMPFLHRITILFQAKVIYYTAVYNVAYLTLHKSMIAVGVNHCVPAILALYLFAIMPRTNSTFWS